MDIERRVCGGNALGRHGGGADGQFTQGLHIGSGEQLTFVGPTFDAALGAHAKEAALGLEDFQAVAMFDGGDGGRLERNVATELQCGGADEGFADGPCSGRPFGTAAENHQYD